MDSRSRRARRILLAMWLSVAALPAWAARNENSNWIIEKWSERPTVGNTDKKVNYHIRVTRKGPPVSGAVLTDYRDPTYTTNYPVANPPADAGGGPAPFIAWNLPSPMNPGDTFEVTFTAQTTGWSDSGANNEAEISGADGLRVRYRTGGEGEFSQTAGGNRAAPQVGDPINAALGEFYFDAPPDLDLGGPLPLFFQRHYSSRMFDSGDWEFRMSWLDTEPNNWMSNFDLWVHEKRAGYPVVYFERGKAVMFAAVTNDAGVQYTLNFRQEPVAWKLQRDGAGHWWFLDPRRSRVYRFNEYGYLREILDRNENRLQVERDSPTGKVTRVSDSLGRSLSFTYGLIENYWGGWYEWLTQVSDGVRTVGFGYHPLMYLGSATNALGGVTAYTNMNNAQPPFVESVTRPNGNTPHRQLYRWSPKQVTNQWDAYGNETHIFYNSPTSGWTTVYHADGHTNVFLTSDRRLGLAVQDGAGRIFTNEYNSREQLTSVRNRLDALTAFAYHEETGQIAAMTNAEGRAIAFGYAAATQTFVNADAPAHTATFAFYDLARADYPDGAREEFAYDARGNRVARTDRGGGIWRYAHDARGQVVAVTNPAGGVRTFAYQTNGLPSSSADSDGHGGAFGYDGLFRVASVTNADGTVRRFVHDALGRMMDAFDEHGNRRQSEYDANGNVVRDVDPLGFAVTYAYDLMDRLTNVSDAAGVLVARTYDSMGRPASLAAGDGAPVVFRYDARGWMTNMTRGGRTWRMTRDDEGVLTSSTRPGGGTTSYQTDRLGQVTGVVDAAGHRWGFERDAMGRVASQTDPPGRVTRFTFDTGGRVASMTRPVVGTASNEFNALGLLSRRVDFNGAAWTYGYSPMGQPASQTNPLGGVVRYTFDARGQPSRVDFADGRHEEYAFDAAGRLQTWRDGASHAWRFGYDARGYTVGLTNPAGGVTRSNYDPAARTATRSDDDTGVESNLFDRLNRLTRIVRPDGAERAFAYNGTNDHLAAVTDETGNAWRYEYDLDGNLARATDPLGRTETYGRDALGRVTNRTDRMGGTSAYAYDAAGRLVRSVSPGGQVVSNVWDDAGRRTAVVFGGRTWQTVFDNEGGVVARQTPLGFLTRYERDAIGQVTAVVNALNERFVIARDGRGRAVSVTDPRGRVRTFAYDGAGNLASASEPGLGAATYQWNSLNRLASITDLNAQPWTFAYSPMGRQTARTDPLGRRTSFGFDALGRVSAVTNADGVTATVAYDPAGRVTHQAYSTGLSLNWAYDADGRLVAADGLALQRDAAGRVTNVVDGGVSFDAAYDADGRLTAVGYNGGAITVAYTYDPVHGGLSRVTDSLTGTRVDFLYDDDLRLVEMRRSNGLHLTNTWDAAGRLTRIRDGGLLDLHYRSDAAGVVTQAVETAPLDPAAFLAPGTHTFAADAAGQIVAAGYGYDACGRLTNAPAVAFAWDGASRLVRAGGAELRYNSLGQLTLRAEGGTTNRFHTHYAIGDCPIVAERDGEAGPFRRYYAGTPDGRLLYLVDVSAGNQVLFYHFDRLGSTRALTDAAGAVTDAYAYDPHGRVLGRTGGSSQPFTFAGRAGVRQEGTNGLYHMRTRYYDAVTARFVSRDAVWPRLARPLDLNPYAYVLNDPLNAIDPSGREPTESMAFFFAQIFTEDLVRPEEEGTSTEHVVMARIFKAAQAAGIPFEWADMEAALGPDVARIVWDAVHHPEKMAELQRRSEEEARKRERHFAAFAEILLGNHEAPSRKPGWRTPDEWIKPMPGLLDTLPSTRPMRPGQVSAGVHSERFPGGDLRSPEPRPRTSRITVVSGESPPGAHFDPPPLLPRQSPGTAWEVDPSGRVLPTLVTEGNVIPRAEAPALSPPSTWRTPDEWIHPAPRPPQPAAPQPPAMPPPSTWRTPDEWIHQLPPPANLVEPPPEHPAISRRAWIEELRRRIAVREDELANGRRYYEMAQEIEQDKDHPVFYFCAYFWDWALNLAPARQYSSCVAQELGQLRQELAEAEQEVDW